MVPDFKVMLTLGLIISTAKYENQLLNLIFEIDANNYIFTQSGKYAFDRVKFRILKGLAIYP